MHGSIRRYLGDETKGGKGKGLNDMSYLLKGVSVEL